MSLDDYLVWMTPTGELFLTEDFIVVGETGTTIAVTNQIAKLLTAKFELLGRL